MTLTEEIIIEMARRESITGEHIDAVGLTIQAIDSIIAETANELEEDIDISDVLLANVLTIPGNEIKYRFIKFI